MTTVIRNTFQKILAVSFIWLATLSVHAASYEVVPAVAKTPETLDVTSHDIDDVIESLERAATLKSVPKGPVSTDLCLAYIKKGDWQQARAWCDRAVEKSTYKGAAFINRGVLRAVLGEYELALADFQKALRISNYPPANGALQNQVRRYRKKSMDVAVNNLAIAEQRFAAARESEEKVVSAPR